MHSFTDIILVLLFIFAAVTALTKKEMIAAKKQKLYTKESRVKFAIVSGYIYIFLAVLSTIYALCNHGILGFSFNMWLYYGLFLLFGVFGILICEKKVLVKTAEGAAETELKKKGEEEDF